jgi:HK97 family phage portal protein
MEFCLMPIQYPNGWLEAMNRSGKLYSPADAYRLVPMLYRAVNLRADALSSVPFQLTRNDQQVEWPWQMNVPQLIKDTERSLLVFGAAYWLRVVKGRTLTGFICLNPANTTWFFDQGKADIYDPYRGMIWSQTLNGRLYGPWTIDDIVYFREPSFVEDVGPGLAPAAVALQHAQLSHYLTAFATAFFQGGAQPVTVMNLPEYTDTAEVERFSADINAKAGGGIMNAFKYLFLRSPDLKVTQITPNIDTMQMPELSERTITAMAATLGVPRTMLEASAANYATADSDRQSFWRETITPRLNMYESVINSQLLNPLKYQFRFDPETMDVFQTDEAARSSSFLHYVQGGIPARSAAQLLGVDNLDQYWPADTAPTPVVTETVTETVNPAPVSETLPVETEIVALPADAEAKNAEWALLAKKIERRIKTGRDPKTSFDSALIPIDRIDAVMERCYKGMTVADVHEIIQAIKAPVDDMTPDELRIYNRIIKEMRAKGQQWAKDIANEKTPETSLREIIKPVLDTELNTTMGKRIDRIGTQFGIPMDTGDQSRYIQDWLLDYTPKTTAKIDQTTADRIKPIIEMFRTTSGMTIQDIEAAVLPLSDPVRAKMIAITETTRASSQATTSYKDYLAQRGIQMIRVWNTENDEIVKKCPICYPLNGKTEDVWGSEFPDGAPAHVNCRCDTSLRLVK